MAKLDNQNRLTVPKSIMEISETDFSSELRLFFRCKELYLDNPSSQNSTLHCLGQITLDNKNRFFLPKLAREIFGLKSGDNIQFYLLNGKVTFRKFFFIPENR